MAAAATHIVLANKIYKSYFTDKDFSEFIVGTSFPDIRYLGVVDRSVTHFYNLKIDDLKNEDSFTAGLKLHSLVDEVREKYVKQNGLYQLFPQSQFITQSVKFFEDRVLYKHLDNWQEIVKSFDHVYKSELAFGVGEGDIKKWHDLLITFLSKTPVDQDIYDFVERIGKPKEVAHEMIGVINGASDSKKANQIIMSFYNNFEDLIQNT